LAYIGGNLDIIDCLVKHVDAQMLMSPLSPYARSSLMNASQKSSSTMDWQLAAPRDLSTLSMPIQQLSAESDSITESSLTMTNNTEDADARKKKKAGVRRLLSKAASKVRKMVSSDPHPSAERPI
jgi:hypothetical protein